MRDPLRRITIIFSLIALLPVGLILYQLGLISSNEAIVREAYRNQLDAILFSVNQYSDDLISSWANRIRLEVREHTGSGWMEERLRSSVTQTDVIKYVYLGNLRERSEVYPTTDDNSSLESVKTDIESLLNREEDRVRRLIEYEQAGFRKMEPVNTLVAGKFIPILFVLDSASEYRVGALVVDLPRFISSSLAPRLQSISQDRFVISAIKESNDSIVYSTDPSAAQAEQSKPVAFKEDVQKRDFWVLPGYYLGISLKGPTVDELARARTGTTLAVLGFLSLVLGGGMVFLYRNIRREINLSRAKSEFVSNVSHEIRTPLSLIGMFAETLETGRVANEDKKKEYYGIISKETARLSRIVNRILNFSQLEANRKQLRLEQMDLNALCADILKSYFHHFEDKGFAFDFLPQPELPAVMADREAVSEVLINLLDNAVKYSRENKHIAVTTGIAVAAVYLDVQDEGIGIAKAHQKDVFEQFFRAPTGDVHTTKGTGLGLTLVRKIMQAHGGTVELKSTPGKGSTFRILFPLKPEKNAT